MTVELNNRPAGIHIPAVFQMDLQHPMHFGMYKPQVRRHSV